MADGKKHRHKFTRSALRRTRMPAPIPDTPENVAKAVLNTSTEEARGLEVPEAEPPQN